jgi:hypothetical protein
LLAEAETPPARPHVHALELGVLGAEDLQAAAAFRRVARGEMRLELADELDRVRGVRTL